jgi:hypothetical protein
LDPTPVGARSRVSCCVLVLVDQSTEDIAAAQLTNARCTIGSAPTDGPGVAWAKLRCGRRWL